MLVCKEANSNFLNIIHILDSEDHCGIIEGAEAELQR